MATTKEQLRQRVRELSRKARQLIRDNESLEEDIENLADIVCRQERRIQKMESGFAQEIQLSLMVFRQEITQLFGIRPTVQPQAAAKAKPSTKDGQPTTAAAPPISSDDDDDEQDDGVESFIDPREPQRSSAAAS